MIAKIEDLKKIRSIAENIRNGRLEPYIQEVELLTIIPAIGAKLYKDVEANPAGFTELLEGGYYDGDSKYFNGLLASIAYLAYGRMLLQNSLNVSPFGNVIKSGEFSTPADSKLTILASKTAENTGVAYLSQCLEYLRFTNQMPCGTSVESKSRKFIVVEKKTKYDGL